MTRLSFRQKVQLAREDAIVSTVKRLLAEKGFDLMTVDEVAAEVGIAKASLYKHFPSKEALAAAAMVQMMDLALQQVQAQDDLPGASAIDKLRAITRWTLQTQLAGEMPTLPAENSSSWLRDRCHLAAISSALMPCGTRPSGYRSAMSVPNGSLPGSTEEPIGTRDIDSTPAAITMS